MKHKISPLLLAANFANLAEDIEMINRSEADWLHLDIMDGVFVPNISFGFPVIKASADIMLDLIIGEKKEDALHLAELFLKMIKDSITDEEMKELDEAAALPRCGPHARQSQVNCAGLAYYGRNV